MIDSEDEKTPVDFHAGTNGANGNGSDPMLTAAAASVQIARLQRADKKRADEVDTVTEDVAAIKKDVAEIKAMTAHNGRATQMLGSQITKLYATRHLSTFAGAFLAVAASNVMLAAVKALWLLATK